MKKLLALAAFATASMFPLATFAASHHATHNNNQSNSLTATLQVNDECDINGTGTMNFGTITAINYSNVTGTGTVTVTCANANSASLALNDQWNTGSSTFYMGPVSNHYVTYNICDNAGFTNCYVNNGAGIQTSQINLNGQATVNLYGNLTQTGTLFPGTYNDTVYANLSFT